VGAGNPATSAAMPTRHTTTVHMGHRIGLERVATRFQRERRATRDAHAGMVSAADCGVHPELLLDHALTTLHGRSHLGLDAPLLVQHAFTLRNHHLGPLEIGGEGLLDHLQHALDVVGVVHDTHPLHAHATDGGLDRVPGAAVLVVGP